MRKQTKLVAVLSAAALLAIGASMTSYAAGGWVAEGDNDWVYLNSDGERITNEWKRSGDNYYYLDEDGLMAKNTLIHDDDADAIYYVNENGTKVMDDWVMLENTEGEQPGDMDEAPSVLYYHFGPSGKADRASDGTAKKVKNIGGKYYVFDEEGRALSGWQTVHVDGEPEYYYLGTDQECWAYTGWQKLEPDENITNKNYDDFEWFYFGSNGRAYKNETKYINGKYYTFGEYGILESDWYAISATNPNAVENGTAYAAENGTNGKGWVLAKAIGHDDNDDEKYWYYLVSVRTGNNIVRSVPFNFFGKEGVSIEYTDPETGVTVSTGTAINQDAAGEAGYRAKVIKNKTYIFNSYGQMLTGFVVVDKKDGADREMLDAVANTNDNDKDVTFRSDAYAKVESRDLANGLYYFSEAGGSTEGQMQTGRVAISQEGETSYYYFEKNSKANDYGRAYTNAIKDGYLYGADGKCIVAEDNNSYEVYPVPATTSIVIKDKSINGKYETVKRPTKTNDNGELIVDGLYVVVSKTGKVKKNGTVTIDGMKYTIGEDDCPYAVTNMTPID